MGTDKDQRVTGRTQIYVNSNHPTTHLASPYTSYIHHTGAVETTQVIELILLETLTKSS